MFGANVENVTAADWQQWIDTNDGLILDVREPMEWAAGTLPDARRVALGELPAALQRLDPTVPLLLVCRSGNRSLMAARYLAANGFDRVANLTGGMVAAGFAA